MQMTTPEFHRCITQMQQGDRDGLKRVYEEYSQLVYAAVRPLLPTPEDAEDVTVDFFIRLWEKADGWRPGTGHRRYITTAACRLAIDRRRKCGREYPAENMSAWEGADGGAATEDLVCNRMALREALAVLSADERTILHLHLTCDLPFREVGRLLHQPLGTVAWRYRNAIQKLRERSDLYE